MDGANLPHAAQRVGRGAQLVKTIDRVVYVIRNKVNGKRYVGIAKYGTAIRWRAHVRAAMRGGQCYLQRAIRKHAPKSFSICVVQRCNNDAELRAAEKRWIAKLDTYQHGYNQTKGGDGQHGLHHSAKTKRTLKRQNRRRMRSPEMRAVISERFRALWQQPTFRRKVRRAQKAAQRRPEVKAKRAATRPR